MQDKNIGRVLSTDNFRVYIKIDDDLQGTYKSGISDIYEIAKINSYLIIPVGPDRVVALITRITMKEETDFDKITSTITLPTSARYISATMLGTITKQNDEERFIQGVYNFPTLDNPVWYVTKKDLEHIFDERQDGKKIQYEKDFYLPIGTSPTFSDYEVKICPDQFFVKHAAILGNTGSGKSCTFTSIIRNLFRFDYKNDKKLTNAHIVLFDTNGEYNAAFLPDENSSPDENKDELKHINAYYYGGEETLQVPYWFMNWSDFNSLLKPSENTQAPILNRAIGLAKNKEETENSEVIPRNLRTDIEKIIDSSSEELKKKTSTSSFGTYEWKMNNEIQNIGKAIEKHDKELGEHIIELGNKCKFNDALKQSPLQEKIKNRYNFLNQESLEKQITSEKNIDLPTWFSYKELCTKFIDAAINQEKSTNNRIHEYVSTLRLRMNSFLNDKRMAVPLMLKNTAEAHKNILAHFIAFILGDFNRFFAKGNHQKSFIDTYNDERNNHNDTQRTNQITIVDVSQLPFEVLETVTALIGRIILEFVSNFMPDERGQYPIVIVLEEAQNYIAEKRESVAKTVFERIAREGRKYGISLVICSQRPSELSRTVLSQCNSFIIHRLQNPDDQQYIKGLVSSANVDILNQLPIIPQQHAIVTGDCVRTPIQVKIADVAPTPNSHNPEYIKNWLDDEKEIPYEKTCNDWLGTPQQDGNNTILHSPKILGTMNHRCVKNLSIINNVYTIFP